MKNIGAFLLVILLSSNVLLLISASPATTKEHKKKLLDKLRAALTTNDAAEDGSVLPVVPPAAAEPSDTHSVVEDKVVVEEDQVLTGGVSVIQDEIGGSVETTSSLDNSNKPDTESVTSTYMARFRTVFKRVMEMLGLRRRKDGRGSRLLAFDRMDDNGLDSRVPLYQEEVRTTVGAVLGRKECVQKAACVSGSYLKGIKGKQLIFALLDVFSPTSWKETVKIAKQSAIFNETCNYKCLDE